MADRTIQILPGGQSSAPFTYTVPPSSAFELLGIRATFNGASAVQAWLPAVQIVSDAGVEMIHTEGASVAAGGTADVAFFPWSRSKLTRGGVSYASQIILLKAAYTCVAEWRLSDGAAPYADTSGFNPGDPATMVRQVLATPMTQNFASGPLAEAPAGPSVAFNFDGDAGSGTGDYLHGSELDPSRYSFTGNAIFTLVAWVLPGVSSHAHLGPVVSRQAGGVGNNNGWELNVTEPGLLPQFARAAAAANRAAYNTATGATPLSTGSWSMLVGTYDGATLRLYVNGVQVASAASAGFMIGGSAQARIGDDNYEIGDIGTWFFGGVAQVSIWAATFTATDVANLYASASV